MTHSTKCGGTACGSSSTTVSEGTRSGGRATPASSFCLSASPRFIPPTLHPVYLPSTPPSSLHPTPLDTASTPPPLHFPDPFIKPILAKARKPPKRKKWRIDDSIWAPRKVKVSVCNIVTCNMCMCVCSRPLLSSPVLTSPRPPAPRLNSPHLTLPFRATLAITTRPRHACTGCSRSIGPLPRAAMV